MQGGDRAAGGSEVTGAAVEAVTGRGRGQRRDAVGMGESRRRGTRLQGGPGGHNTAGGSRWPQRGKGVAGHAAGRCRVGGRSRRHISPAGTSTVPFFHFALDGAIFAVVMANSAK